MQIKSGINFPPFLLKHINAQVLLGKRLNRKATIWLSNLTLQTCNCVQFLARSETTHICGAVKDAIILTFMCNRLRYGVQVLKSKKYKIFKCLKSVNLADRKWWKTFIVSSTWGYPILVIPSKNLDCLDFFSFNKSEKKIKKNWVLLVLNQGWNNQIF